MNLVKKPSSITGSTEAGWGDEDEPFSAEELLAIDAIEAAHKSSSPLTTNLPKIKSTSCEQDQTRKTHRRLPKSLLTPCQGTSSVKYPVMRFEGKILYCITNSQVECAARQLRKVIKDKKSQGGQVILGFDIEWRPNFVKGAVPKKAALMQLCIDSSHCHLMQIIHSGIPLSLRHILEDSTIMKVGVGIGNDALKVFQDYGVSVNNVEELSDLAKQKVAGLEKWSLAYLTEIVAHKELLKPKKIRLGNWEAKCLSKAQLQYAATDAYVSLHLYQILMALPDIVHN